MIVSHRHRFIFAAVPKTGTHAVRAGLRPELGPEDLEQVGLFRHRRFPWTPLAAIAHGHLALHQLRPHLGEAQFADYVKFAFVRNPFDRFVSFCAFMLRGGDAFARDPRGAMRHFLWVDPPEGHVLFQPQAALLLDRDGRTLLLDAIGRFETMQASFDAICRRIGVGPRPLARINASARGDYRAYYDPPLVAAVTARYAVDLDLFGYRFAEPA